MLNLDQAIDDDVWHVGQEAKGQRLIDFVSLCCVNR